MSFLRSGLDLAKNYVMMDEKPKTYNQLKGNRRKRHIQLLHLLTDLNNFSSTDKAATAKFWAVQTWFLMRLLKNHSAFLNEKFNLSINEESLSKINIINIINQLMIILATHENRKDLIDLIIEESKPTFSEDAPEKEKEDSTSSPPSLCILQQDLTQFLNQQIAAGKKVSVLNPANAQRPGASAYERGTAQEALTRMSNCYWMFVTFRDVLKEAQEKGMTDVKEKVDVDVLHYQCRYLTLLLNFIKKSIEMPSYFKTIQFREDFLKFDKNFYNEMQNTVFELPVYECTMVECHFGDFSEITATVGLFDNHGNFKTELLDECAQGSALIGHCAAPDLRLIPSKVDRGCTAYRDRQNSRDKEIADKIIRANVNDYLDKAITLGVDTLVLTALGCGAFMNEPKEVAAIFAEVLQSRREQLQDKSIYFIDLNVAMCFQFAEIFNEKLNRFNISQVISRINILTDKIKLVGNLQEAMVVPYRTSLAKKYTDSVYSNAMGHIVYIKNKIETKADLVKAYKTAILDSLGIVGLTTLRLPLLGTGKSGFSAENSAEALLIALKDENVQAHQNSNKVTICLHVLDQSKYEIVVSNLTKKSSDPSIKEVGKNYQQKINAHYSIPNPTKREKMVFEGGNTKTMWYVALKGAIPYTEMLPGQLILGRFPNKEDAKLLKDDFSKLSLVVSVLQSFELCGQGLFSTLPIQTALEWQAMNVEHHQLSVRDVKEDDFNTELLIKTVLKIRAEIEAGNCVLVHCKAGLSRSATVVLLYLYLYHCKELLDDNMGENPQDNIQKLCKWMKEKRQQVSLHPFHQAIVLRASQHIDMEPELFKIKTINDYGDNLDQQLDAYFMSNQSKEDLMQMAWFKKMVFVGISKYTVVQGCLNKLRHAHTSEQIALALHENDDKVLFPIKFHLYHELINFLSIKFNQSREVIEAALNPTPANIFARRAKDWLRVDYHIEGHAELSFENNVFEFKMLGTYLAPQIKESVLIELAAHIQAIMNMFASPVSPLIVKMNSDEKDNDEDITLKLQVFSQTAANLLISLFENNNFAKIPSLHEPRLLMSK